MLDTNLWKQIESFDLDAPLTEYPFSVRLAAENGWTINFTNEVILEYKKFMYLAATADTMVSPSEIVDVVWHQHLVFTQSYQQFCDLLGRKVEHVPSTRHRADFERFKFAKTKTDQLYNEVFGEQPETYWKYADIYEPLDLPKAKFKIRTFTLIGVLVNLVLLLPAYYLLKPLYLQISGPYFLIGYGMLITLAFLILHIINSSKLLDFVETANSKSFIFNLTPLELVYLSKLRKDDVIHGQINQMFINGQIEIDYQKKLTTGKGEATNPFEFLVLDIIADASTISYSNLIERVILKPVTTNIADSMDGLTKYIVKSRMFVRLFVLNFIVYSAVLIPGLVRLWQGIERDRPVVFLMMMLFFLCPAIYFMLSNLSSYIASALTSYYDMNVVPKLPLVKSWDWGFYLMPTAVLALSFAPVYESYNHQANGGGSSGSSCGSSCGGGGCGGGGCGG